MVQDDILLRLLPAIQLTEAVSWDKMKFDRVFDPPTRGWGPNDFFMCAQRHNQVIAAASLHIAPDVKSIAIEYLEVAKDARREHLGEVLIRAVIEEAVSQGRVAMANGFTLLGKHLLRAIDECNQTHGGQGFTAIGG